MQKHNILKINPTNRHIRGKTHNGSEKKKQQSGQDIYKEYKVYAQNGLSKNTNT